MLSMDPDHPWVPCNICVMRPTLPRSVVATLMETDAWLVETLLQSILSLCGKSMYMLRFSLLNSWWVYSTDEKRSTIAEVATKLTPKVFEKA